MLLCLFFYLFQFFSLQHYRFLYGQLSHQQLENFSLAFGNFGNDPYIDSIDGHDNIIEVRREADEKAPPFGASWHSDWSFQECPPSATLLHSKIIPPIGVEGLVGSN